MKQLFKEVSTHSSPKAAGCQGSVMIYLFTGFQHTAARRRLVVEATTGLIPSSVSTHSSPKAAGKSCLKITNVILKFQHTAARRRLGLPEARFARLRCFNTQQPEGGWIPKCRHIKRVECFNTQQPEGGWSARY